MKKTKILIPFFGILLIVGLVIMIVSIVVFPYNMVEARDNLRDFDDDRQLYSFSPNNSSGTHVLPSFIFLPQEGRFDLRIFCDEAKGRNDTPFTVALSITANISGTTSPISLNVNSLTSTSYFSPDGTQIIDPLLDKPWKSNEYAAGTNITLNLSYTCNFNGWSFKILYLNDTLSDQRSVLVDAKTAALTTFGVGLALSIISFVIGVIGTIVSVVFHVRSKRKGL